MRKTINTRVLCCCMGVFLCSFLTFCVKQVKSGDKLMVAKEDVHPDYHWTFTRVLRIWHEEKKRDHLRKMVPDQYESAFLCEFGPSYYAEHRSVLFYKKNGAYYCSVNDQEVRSCLNDEVDAYENMMKMFSFGEDVVFESSMGGVDGFVFFVTVSKSDVVERYFFYGSQGKLGKMTRNEPTIVKLQKSLAFVDLIQ